VWLSGDSPLARPALVVPTPAAIQAGVDPQEVQVAVVRKEQKSVVEQNQRTDPGEEPPKHR
jgi:hypothetical protein